MKKEKLTVRFEPWNHTCFDGCCYDYGTDLFINDKHVSSYAECNQAIIETLEFLGYEVEVI